MPKLGLNLALANVRPAGGSSAASPIPIDVFIDFEGAAAGTGITTTICEDSTTRLFSNAFGEWAATADALAQMTVETEDSPPLPASFSLGLGGTLIDDSAHTKGIRTTMAVDDNYVSLEFPASMGPFGVTLLFAFKKGETTEGNNMDLVRLRRNGGGTTIMNANGQNVRVHSGTGGTPSLGDDILISADTWYYGVLRATSASSGNSSLHIYNAAKELVGSSTNTATDLTSIRYIQFGRTDNVGGTPGDTDIVFGWAALDVTFTVTAADMMAYNASNYPSIVTTLSASDTFTRADGAMGANWEDVVDGFEIASNNAVATQTLAEQSTGNSVRYVASAFNADQISRATIIWENGPFFGVAVRMTGTDSTQKFYTYYTNSGSARGIRRRFDGTETTLLDISGLSWTEGVEYDIELRVYGPLLRAFRDDTQIGYVFDNQFGASYVSEGEPGLYGWQGTFGTPPEPRYTEWSADNLVI